MLVHKSRYSEGARLIGEGFSYRSLCRYGIRSANVCDSANDAGSRVDNYPYGIRTLKVGAGALYSALRDNALADLGARANQKCDWRSGGECDPPP